MKVLQALPPIQEDHELTMSADEVSRELGICKAAVYRAAREKSLPAIVYGSRVVFLRPDVERIKREGLLRQPAIIEKEDTQRMIDNSQLIMLSAQLAAVEAQAKVFREGIEEIKGKKK